MPILGGSAEFYIQKFLDNLQEKIPETKHLQFRWCDTLEIHSVENKFLLKAIDLKTLDALPAKINGLSDQGKSWINIYGEGKIDERTFLISIAYNRENTNARATSINTGGFCSLNFDGTLRLISRVTIVD